MSQKDQTKQDKHPPMIVKDCSDEVYREYSWIEPAKNERVVYRIDEPYKVHFYQGCTTHRVVDKVGVVHCVPAVGYYGCVLRWKVKPGSPAVSG